MFLISQVRCADMPAARQTNHSVVFGVNKSKIDKHLPKRKKCDTLKVDEVLCLQHFSFQTLVNFNQRTATYRRVCKKVSSIHSFKEGLWLSSIGPSHTRSVLWCVTTALAPRSIPSNELERLGYDHADRQ